MDSNLVLIQDLVYLSSGDQLNKNTPPELRTDLKRFPRISYQDATAAEVYLLYLLGWDVHRVLPLDFLQIFLQILGQNGWTEQNINLEFQNSGSLNSSKTRPLESPKVNSPRALFYSHNESLLARQRRPRKFRNKADPEGPILNLA